MRYGWSGEYCTRSFSTRGVSTHNDSCAGSCFAGFDADPIILHTTYECIIFLAAHGLLMNSVNCPQQCRLPLQLLDGGIVRCRLRAHADGIDGYRWKYPQCNSIKWWFVMVHFFQIAISPPSSWFCSCIYGPSMCRRKLSNQRYRFRLTLRSSIGATFCEIYADNTRLRIFSHSAALTPRDVQ